MAAALAMLLRIVGLGAVLSAVSEVWFYPVTLDAHVIGLCAFYGPLAYVPWLVMARTGVRGWAGAFWGACLFGFLVEGVPVQVLYEALPFTIFWTSISWHALISVAVGLWLFRVVSARKGTAAQIAAFVAAGVYLGAWSVELWSLREDGSDWLWTPTGEVAVQLLAGWAMFVAGHVCLDLAARFTVVPARWELPLWGGLMAFFFCLGMLVAVFPLSLVLPVLVALSWWLMAREGQGGGPSPFLVRLSNLTVPLPAYVMSLLVPLCAAGAYHLLTQADLRLESAALHILWAGPVSLALLIWSAVRTLRPTAR